MIDGLTGAPTRDALREKINLQVEIGDGPFVARLLCVDIDNLRAYLDMEGFGPGGRNCSLSGTR